MSEDVFKNMLPDRWASSLVPHSAASADLNTKADVFSLARLENFFVLDQNKGMTHSKTYEPQRHMEPGWSADTKLHQRIALSYLLVMRYNWLLCSLYNVPSGLNLPLTSKLFSPTMQKSQRRMAHLGNIPINLLISQLLGRIATVVLLVGIHGTEPTCNQCLGMYKQMNVPSY